MNIMQYLAHHRDVSNQQAQRVLDKSAPTVRCYLNKFVSCGSLQAAGNNKSRRYLKNE